MTSRKIYDLTKMSDRLRYLRNVVVRQIRKQEFDMNHWQCTVGKPRGKEAHRTKCGTTRCIAGWAAVDPKLIAQGLTLKVHPDDVRRRVKYYGIRVRNQSTADMYQALANFFGIRRDDAARIFGPEHYGLGFDKTPAKKEIIDRIDNAGYAAGYLWAFPALR